MDSENTTELDEGGSPVFYFNICRYRFLILNKQLARNALKQAAHEATLGLFEPCLARLAITETTAGRLVNVLQTSAMLLLGVMTDMI